MADGLKNTHRDLQDSEAKFRRLFEASRDPIFIWDMDKKNVDINVAGLKMFGFKDRSEALSIETIDQLFWDARDRSAMFKIIGKKGFVKEHEVSMVNRWGKRLDVLVTANLLRNEKGEAEGVQGVLRDVTAKKKLEKHLAQTEKLASIGQLASGIAHEINNPLGVILCYANLIEKSIDGESQVKSDLEKIKKHTVGCTRIVEDLLNFSRVSDTKKTKTDIHEGIEEILSILKQNLSRRQISIHRNYGKDIPRATIDTDKMKQVYMNILMNAEQAINGGGEITIDTAFNVEDHIIKIKIADTGSGINPENIESIFDPFFTTKKTGKGTGLGLSISYGIVKDHDGDLRVESTVGKGSVFTILLPAG